MKTPTPQEQAEMLIKMHFPFAYDGFGMNINVKKATEKINATKAAIVTVETVLSAKPIGNSLEYWQEVLTILKEKL